MPNKIFSRLSLFATFLAFLVVVLGAYVRLSNAGLGCPDWPGCYGHMGVPSAEKAQLSHPDSPLVPSKAWKEMVHRYLAGTLGLLVLSLAILSLKVRRERNIPVFLPWFLLALVIFQALLGMWTVTLKLHPLVVMAHLLGGFATLGLLGWMSLCVVGRGRATGRSPLQSDHSLRLGAILGLILLILQIALGGWMSANYASLACPDFPTCQGHWWPAMNLKEALTLWREIGPNYEGGVLDNPARMTIHWFHRLGAVVLSLFLLFLSVKAWKMGGWIRVLGVVIGTLLVLQISLGISNILFQLPIAVATAHNGVAALLFLSLIALPSSLAIQGGAGIEPKTKS